MANSGENSNYNKIDLALREKAYNTCGKFLGGQWNKISVNDMIIKVVSGGLVNHLYHCSLPDNKKPLKTEPSEVLFRIYGQSNLDYIDIIANSVITAILSERKLGPKLYGVFPGGRLEEYIPSRLMKCKELGDPIYSTLIARKLAMIHSMDMPINKEPNTIIDVVYGMLKSIRTAKTVDKTAKVNTIDVKLEQELLSIDFESEFKWLIELIDKTDIPIVFCHNDLLGGNILIRDNDSNKIYPLDERIMFIDFEFCAYNYRGFDIGNHFIEYMFDYNNPEWPHYFAYLDSYPNENKKLYFIREYIKQSKTYNNNIELTEDKLLKEADYCGLVSYFLACLWGIDTARTSKIPFGHLEFAKIRMDIYFDHKKKIMKKYGL